MDFNATNFESSNNTMIGNLNSTSIKGEAQNMTEIEEFSSPDRNLTLSIKIQNLTSSEKTLIFHKNSTAEAMDFNSNFELPIWGFSPVKYASHFNASDEDECLILTKENRVEVRLNYCIF